MIKILPEMRQIIIEPDESRKIRDELVEAFVALDTETKGNHYSGNNMEKKYPKLWTLYCTV